MKQTGFTLIEMLMTMAVAAILVVLAVPSYLSFIQNNASLTLTNSIAAALNYARIEAIKRGVPVAVCAAQGNPPTACGDATTWLNGWMIFVDDNSNQIIDAQADYLKIEQIVPTGVTVTANTGVVSYNSSGYLSSTPLTMVIQPSQCSGNQVKTITVIASGRLNVQTSTCPGG